MTISLTGPNGQTIAVTSTSVATLIADTPEKTLYPFVIVQNVGDNACFLKAGGAGVVASTASVMLPGQWREVFRKDLATHLAAVCASGLTTTLAVMLSAEEA